MRKRLFIHLICGLLMALINTHSFGQSTDIDSLRLRLSKTNLDTQYVRTLLTLSNRFSPLNYDSSLLYAKKGYRLSVDLQYTRGQARGYSKMGSAYISKALYDSAIWAFDHALELFTEKKDSLNMGRTLTNLGLSYRFNENYATASVKYFKALELKKKFGSRRDLAIAYQNLGVVFAIQREFERAEQYLKDAILIYKEIGDSSKYYSGLMDLSSMFRDNGKYDKALKGLHESYQYRLRIGDKTPIGICVYNLALTSYLNKEYDESISFFNQAKSIFTELGSTRRLVGCHVRLARLYLDLNQYSASEKECEAGLELTTSSYQLQRLHGALSEIYFNTGRYKLAYTHQAKHNHISDSTLRAANRVKMVEMQNKFDDEANKREIAELTFANGQIEQKAKNKDLLNYILWGAFIVILVIALMYYRLFRIKQRTNDALRDKNQIIQHSLEEKDVLLREIHHRVQNNLQFVSSLLNLQARQVDDQKTLDVLKGCKQRIQSMALIHQKLYQETSLNRINILNYTQNLVESLQSSYGIDSGSIRTELNIDKIHLDINSAISIGLILSELVTNCYKYAFTGKEKGLLSIGLHEQGDILVMNISDNGNGLPKDFDMDNVSSFGLKLVYSLAKKLKADVSIESKEGTSVTLKINSYTKIQHDS